MSLNLIIMLLIVLIVMGLIIVFVNNFLGNEGAKPDPAREKELELVLQKSGNFEFYERNLTIQRGESRKLYVKFENPFDNPIRILSNIKVISDDTDNLYYTISDGPNPASLPGSSDIQVVAPPISLDFKEVASFPFIVKVADSQVPTGDYFLEFKTSYNNETDTKNYTRVVSLTVE